MCSFNDHLPCSFFSRPWILSTFSFILLTLSSIYAFTWSSAFRCLCCSSSLPGIFKDSSDSYLCLSRLYCCLHIPSFSWAFLMMIFCCWMYRWSSSLSFRFSMALAESNSGGCLEPALETSWPYIWSKAAIPAAASELAKFRFYSLCCIISMFLISAISLSSLSICCGFGPAGADPLAGDDLLSFSCSTKVGLFGGFSSNSLYSRWAWLICTCRLAISSLSSWIRGSSIVDP